MKKLALIVFLSIAGILALYPKKVSVADNSIGTERWVRQMFLKNRQLPFSFKLDGKESGTFISGWSRQLKPAGTTVDGGIRYNLEMGAPDGSLKLDCEITAFPDSHAAEWVVRFTNPSSMNSAKISDVNVADIDFSTKTKNPDWKLFTAKGTTDSENDFHLQVFAPADTTLHFRPDGGRSSSVSAFPFFNLAESNRQGICIAIGWSGTWFSDFIPTAGKGNIGFTAGMEGMDIFLYPGESVRTPKVAILQWGGNDRQDGNNALRRFLLAHHSPRFGSGEAVVPPLCMGLDFGDPAPSGEYEGLTELLGRAIVERHRNFKIMPEVFWLDAGWYEGNNAPESREQGRWWYSTVGSWEADPTRFPNGLKPMADAMHEAGAKFMVWFEPERVYEGTIIDREHPEWLLHSKDGNKSRLFNLGNPEALDYLCKTIGDFIEKSGIDYYRQDFNIAPAQFWTEADPEGRKGITEIRHIENLYRFWDYLLSRFPDLMIDNCASGGRRLDLETVSRSIPLWRTDCHYGEPTCQQSHEYGLAQFLPLHGTGVYTTDPYCVRSGMSSAFLWAGEVLSSANPVNGIRDAVAVFKELRPYHTKDFYPLSGDGSTLGRDLWIAWQFHDPADGSGVVQAFRRDEAPGETYEVKLRALDKDADYELFDYDTKETVKVSGGDLSSGLSLSLPRQRSSKLLRYRRAATL